MFTSFFLLHLPLLFTLLSYYSLKHIKFLNQNFHFLVKIFKIILLSIISSPNHFHSMYKSFFLDQYQYNPCPYSIDSYSCNSLTFSPKFQVDIKINYLTKTRIFRSFEIPSPNERETSNCQSMSRAPDVARRYNRSSIPSREEERRPW